MLLMAFLLHGCAPRLPLMEDDSAIRSPLSSKQMLHSSFSITEIITEDPLPRASLIESIHNSLLYLERISPRKAFYYGKVRYTAKEVAMSMRLFLGLLKRHPEIESLAEALEEHFLLFASSANDNRGVLFTGYYEPIYQGSLKYSRTYRIPAYKKPKDLKVLELGSFRKTLNKRTIVYRMERGKVVPYYTRKDIMERRKLRRKGLEIAWFKDPLDLFFLQVQGSGILVTPKGKRVKLSYAGANGRPYSSIGKLLLDENRMSLDDISMGSIRNYLNENPKQKKRILYHNESYTFFQINPDPGGPLGVINVPLTPLRSVAVDVNLFPKAALAFVRTEVPSFDPAWHKTGANPFSGFVLAQDTGGVIRGPERVDLFWGNGELAENSAGAMRSFGQIYYLIAKKEALGKFSSLVSK